MINRYSLFEPNLPQDRTDQTPRQSSLAQNQEQQASGSSSRGRVSTPIHAGERPTPTWNLPGLASTNQACEAGSSRPKEGMFLEMNA